MKQVILIEIANILFTFLSLNSKCSSGMNSLSLLPSVGLSNRTSPSLKSILQGFNYIKKMFSFHFFDLKIHGSWSFPKAISFHRFAFHFAQVKIIEFLDFSLNYLFILLFVSRAAIAFLSQIHFHELIFCCFFPRLSNSKLVFFCVCTMHIIRHKKYLRNAKPMCRAKNWLERTDEKREHCSIGYEVTYAIIYDNAANPSITYNKQ